MLPLISDSVLFTLYVFVHIKVLYVSNLSVCQVKHSRSDHTDNQVLEVEAAGVSYAYSFGEGGLKDTIMPTPYKQRDSTASMPYGLQASPPHLRTIQDR